MCELGSEKGRKGGREERGKGGRGDEVTRRVAEIWGRLSWQLSLLFVVQVDDGLSVEVLPDGRRRVWIHVADPTRWLQPHDLLDM